MGEEGVSSMLDGETVLSIISIIISLIAIWQTKISIRLSNKQALFNERIENFGIANEIYNSYIELEKYMESTKKFIPDYHGEEIIIFLEDIFLRLFGIKYFDSISAYGKSLEYYTFDKLYGKIENLSNVALKIYFIFEGKEAEVVKSFLESYIGLLKLMVTYKKHNNNYDIFNTSNIGEKLEFNIINDKLFYEFLFDYAYVQKCSDKIKTEDALSALKEQTRISKMISLRYRIKKHFNKLNGLIETSQRKN